jgi:hypothetical protein
MYGYVCTSGMVIMPIGNCDRAATGRGSRDKLRRDRTAEGGCPHKTLSPQNPIPT